MADDEDVDYDQDFEDDDYGDDEFDEDDPEFKNFMENDHLVVAKKPTDRLKKASPKPKRPSADEEDFVDAVFETVGRTPTGFRTAEEVQARRQRWPLLKKAGVKLAVTKHVELFDLAPLTPYQLYSARRGAFASRTDCDAQTPQADAAVETDEIAIADVETQAPEDRDVPRPAQADGGGGGRRRPAAVAASSAAAELSEAASRRLDQFMLRAGALADALLSERCGKQSALPAAPCAAGGIADSAVLFNDALNLDGRPVLALSLASPTAGQPWQTVLVSYGPRDPPRARAPPPTGTEQADAEGDAEGNSAEGNPAGAAGVDAGAGAGMGFGRPARYEPESYGILCTWSLQAPHAPLHACWTVGVPTACCWGLGDRSFALAGEDDGALCLWDLREAASRHPALQMRFGKISLAVRAPTYTSEGGAAAPAACSARVVGLAAYRDASAADGGPQLFSLLALDEWGVVNLWAVTRASAAEPEALGGLAGLAWGGRARLQLLATLLPYGPRAALGSASAQPRAALGDRTNGAMFDSAGPVLEAFDLCVLAADAGGGATFAVATGGGTVQLGCSAGKPPAPRELNSVPEGRDLGAEVGAVTSLHAHPLFPDALAAGYALGGVCVFHSRSRRPLRRWACASDGGAAILSVRWCTTRPSAIHVLDANGGLLLLDLLPASGAADAGGASHVERVSSGAGAFAGGAGEEPTAMEVTSLPVSQVGSFTKQAVVVAFKSGAVKAHIVESKVPAQTAEEHEALDMLMRSPYQIQK